jgi:EAL domain-containing protein (putative c-di-GMP-specific phosphodiesterase class I)
VFEDAFLLKFDTQLRSVGKARAAVAANFFEPHYQPKFDLGTGQRVGFEALLRWHGPDADRLPNIFHPDFPDKALVAQVGVRMIEKILDDVKRWATSGIHVGAIAINSSAVDFAGDNFGELLIERLRAMHISPRMIELEVTEGVFLGRDVPFTARALRVLRDSGVRIALDDFGTGYASLTHLRQYPVDVLKIDQSFVRGITRSADDAAIVRAVIGLAKNLGIVTVAEGVETAAQDAFVRHHGCDIGQGFLYGKAIPASEINNDARLKTDAVA